MPRASTSTAAKIVGFFRSSPMEVAQLVHGLCADALRERRDKVEKIREGQSKGKRKAKKGPAAAAGNEVNKLADAATKNAAAPKPKAKHRRKRAAKPQAQEPLPPQESPDLDFDPDSERESVGADV